MLKSTLLPSMLTQKRRNLMILSSLMCSWQMYICCYIAWLGQLGPDRRARKLAHRLGMQAWGVGGIENVLSCFG